MSRCLNLKLGRWLVALSLAASASAQGTSVAWQDVRDGVSGADDWHVSVARAAGGGAVACGVTYEEEPAGSGLFIPRAVVRSLSASGSVQWTRVFSTGAWGGNAEPIGVAVQPSGRAVIGGGADFGEDWFVAGFDSNGTLAFSGVWDLNSTAGSPPSDLALDASGNIYLCGNVSDPTFGLAPAVTKFSPLGVVLWSTVLDAGTQLGTARGLCADAAGNVYVAGSSTLGFAYEFSVAKLDSAGNFQWVRNHGSTDPTGNDFGVDVTVDPAGRVLAGGWVSNNTMTSMDVSTIAYSASGQLLWRSDWDGPNGASEFVNAVTFDDYGRVLLAGWRFSPSFDRDAFAVCFEAGGALAWSRVVVAPGTDEEALTIATDGGRGAVLGVIAMSSIGRTAFATVVRADGTIAGQMPFGTFDGDTYFSSAVAGGLGRWYAVGRTAAVNTAPDGLLVAIDTGVLESYCIAGTSAQGCTATLSSLGTPSASATSGFSLLASGLDGQRQGLVFYGVSGRAALAWGPTSSFLCVKSPTQRTPVQVSGGTFGACNGTLGLDWLQFVSTQPGALGTPLQAGSAVQAQAWYRDPPSAKSTALSNGLEFLVLP